MIIRARTAVHNAGLRFRRGRQRLPIFIRQCMLLQWRRWVSGIQRLFSSPNRLCCAQGFWSTYRIRIDCARVGADRFCRPLFELDPQDRFEDWRDRDSTRACGAPLEYSWARGFAGLVFWRRGNRRILRAGDEGIPLELRETRAVDAGPVRVLAVFEESTARTTNTNIQAVPVDAFRSPMSADCAGNILDSIHQVCALVLRCTGRWYVGSVGVWSAMAAAAEFQSVGQRFRRAGAEERVGTMLSLLSHLRNNQ